MLQVIFDIIRRKYRSTALTRKWGSRAWGNMHYVQISTGCSEVFQKGLYLGVPFLPSAGGEPCLSDVKILGNTAPPARFWLDAVLFARPAPLGWMLQPIGTCFLSTPPPPPSPSPSPPCLSRPTITISTSSIYSMPDSCMDPMRCIMVDGRAMDRECDDIRSLFLSRCNLGVVPAVSDLSWNTLPLGMRC